MLTLNSKSDFNIIRLIRAVVISEQQLSLEVIII